MNQYEKYFDDIVEDIYNEINPLVEEIRNVGVCPSCGGIFLLDECLYCRTENSILKEIVPVLKSHLDRFNDIITNLPIESIRINKLFNLLHSLVNIKIDSIDRIFEKYKYIDLYNGYEEEVISRLGKDFNYSPLDINVLETAIERNKKTNTLFPLFVKEAINKNINISYESFTKLTKNYVIYEMNKIATNAKCNIIPIEEMSHKHEDKITVAEAGFNKISISEEEVKLLYYEGSNSLINSIFHEMTHINQFSKFFLGKHLHPYVIEEIKEYILMQKVDGYYKENYRYISFEIEADYYGATKSKELLEEVGFVVDKDSFEKTIEEINIDLNEKRRYLNGEVTSVDELFDKIILKYPELLDIYKQLNLLYRISDGLVYRKNEDELIEDYLHKIDDPNCSIEDKELYKKFYQHFVSRAR